MANELSKNRAPWRKKDWDRTSTKSYSTGEVAKLFEVEEHILRYWEQGTALKPKRFPSGARRYTSEDLELVEKIYYLVVIKGMTLKAASAALENKSPEIEVDLSLRDKLLQVRERLGAIRSDLDRILNDHE